MKADPVADKAMISDTLRTLMAGYVGVTDNPAVVFVGELAELYPEAIVITTTRNPVTWWKSFEDMSETVILMAFLKWLFLPVPTMRYFGDWVAGMINR
jgi:hypothetical protein